MSIKKAVKRFHLIVRCLRKNPATYNEIQDYLDKEGELQECDFNISKKTFRRDLDDIASIYDIEIVYDQSRKVYFIQDEVTDNQSKRMMEAFDVFNALSVSERLSDYIHWENRRASGTEHIYGILHAIKNSKQLNITHQKYFENPTQRKVEPYALKEVANLWYLVVKDLKDAKIKAFALDRIKDIDITNLTFIYPETFNVNIYFKHSFGIMRPNNGTEPQKVILEVDPYQAAYIKALPLHHSQKTISDTDDKLIIELYLYITIDFEMELMKYGKSVKVIEPKELTDAIILNK